MLNRRQLRIKALESVYAYDKSLDKNIDFQISYFLKSNKNFFKLYVTCFSLLKELHLFANELHLKNQKKLTPTKTKKPLAQSSKIIRKPITQIKVGRNDPCPCGSGKKYKQCHG